MLEIDITDIKSIRKYISNNKINIINCAAYTAVEKAEEEFKKADLVNHIAINNFADVAKENDVINPLGVYGKKNMLENRQ